MCENWVKLFHLIKSILRGDRCEVFMQKNEKTSTGVRNCLETITPVEASIKTDSGTIHRARIARFSELRQDSRNMSSWLFHKSNELKGLKSANADLMAMRMGYFAEHLRGCGSYLLFKHYYTLDTYRLAKMKSCKKHMLCRFCSAIRATKQAMAYHEKMQLLLEHYDLKPVFITLTVKNGGDFLERFNHLMSSFKKYQKAKRDWHNRGTGFNELCKCEGIVYSIEITNKNKGWHPHLHMVALVDDWIDRVKLSREWLKITGDSKIVDVRRLKPFVENGQNNYMDAFLEVFKYAMKFSDLTYEQIWYVHEALSPNGRLMRLQGTLGLFRGVHVPEYLTDEEIAKNSPFMAIMYHFLAGSGYSVVATKDYPFGEVLEYEGKSDEDDDERRRTRSD